MLFILSLKNRQAVPDAFGSMADIQICCPPNSDFTDLEFQYHENENRNAAVILTVNELRALANAMLNAANYMEGRQDGA